MMFLMVAVTAILLIALFYGGTWLFVKSIEAIRYRHVKAERAQDAKEAIRGQSLYATHLRFDREDNLNKISCYPIEL